MELISFNVPSKQADRTPIVLAPLGDCQYAGKRGPTAEDILKRHIDKALKLNAYFIGLGDYCDFMSPSNRQRLAAAALYDQSLDVIDDKALDLTLEFYERFLKPTKGRFVALASGHHWLQLRTGETTDMRLCQLLDAPFVGTAGFIRFQFQYGTSRHAINVFVHHGCGGGMKASAPLNKLENLAPYWDADIFLLGHMCLPTSARILTRYGFKHHSEVIIGEDVLTYDVKSRSSRWESVKDVVVYPSAPKFRAKSRSFRVEMTPGHRWVRQNSTGTFQDIIPFEEIRTGDRIITAAPAPSGTLSLAAREAAILAWIVTDGSLKFHGNGITPDCRIYQINTSPHVKGIRRLLSKDATEYKQSPTGELTWYLHVDFIRPLLDSVGVKSKDDYPSLVTRLSSEARRTMIQVFLDAEGARGSRFSQNPGPIWDTFLILAALEGIRLGRGGRAYKKAKTPLGVIKKGKVLRIEVLRRGGPLCRYYIKTEPVADGPVWCPITSSGTWVAEFDRQVFITGNTKQAVAPINRITPRWNDKEGHELIHKKIYLVGCGGFSRSYVQGARQGNIPMGLYPEQKLMNPAALGAPLIYITPNRTYWNDNGHQDKKQWTYELSVEV